jgi:hypothetical protein
MSASFESLVWRIARHPNLVYLISLFPLNVVIVWSLGFLEMYAIHSRILTILTLLFLWYYIYKNHVFLQARYAKYLSRLLIGDDPVGVMQALSNNVPELQTAAILLLRRWGSSIGKYLSNGVNVSQLLTGLSVFDSEQKARQFFGTISRFLRNQFVLPQFWDDDENPETVADRVREGQEPIWFVCNGYDALFGNNRGAIYRNVTQFAHDVADVAVADWHLFTPATRQLVQGFWLILDSICTTYCSVIAALGGILDGLRASGQMALDVPLVDIGAGLLGVPPQALLEKIATSVPGETGERICEFLRGTIRQNLTQFAPTLLDSVEDADALVAQEGGGAEFVQKLAAPITSFVYSLRMFVRLPEVHQGLRGWAACVQKAMGDGSGVFAWTARVIVSAEKVATQEEMMLAQLEAELGLPVTLLAQPLGLALKCHGKSLPQLIGEEMGDDKLRILAECVGELAQDIANGERINRPILARRLGPAIE